ncbi:MAG: ArgE/DapE family deacylase [Acidobacteriia bacterium]|nr:ArgE/DapE family deacylase [Terriglobia bacterium]
MNTESQIAAYVASHHDKIVSALAELIAIPTVNPPGRSYFECVEYLSKLLQSWGIEHEMLSIPHESHPRYAIIGAYGKGEDGLHFHGHYDVVIAQSPDQFQPRQHDGRLYGRGSSDMKGGIVAMLFALRALQECAVRLSKKITFTLVPDEETGGRLGMRHLAQAGLLPRAGLGMLMPEPTSGVVWNACRGALTLRVRIKGKTAHVGLPHQGVNAFEGMAAVLNSLLSLKPTIVARRTSLPLNPPEASSSVMVLGGESGSGSNFNSVPESAWFSVDRRINPEENLAQAKEELDRVFERHRREGLDIEVEIVQEGEPAVAPAETRLGKILARTVTDVIGIPPAFELCPGILETRFFTNQGIPGYGYGPGVLEISHGPNEYVDLDALRRCTIVYALTAVRLLG